MKILDLKDDDLFCLYQDYISDEEFESIRDNAFCMIENHDNDVLIGADYLYDDFLSWLQQREDFTDDEVSIFINVHGDYIYENIVAGLS